MDKRQAQADGDIITALCSLPKIISEDGQDYVQLADVLETVRRYKPSVAIPSKNTEIQGDDRWLLHFGQNMAIPSAEPKTGHWEWVQYDYNPQIGNWHCSECRCVVVECVDKNEKGGIPLYKYCPQCGAKMN